MVLWNGPLRRGPITRVPCLIVCVGNLIPWLGSHGSGRLQCATGLPFRSAKGGNPRPGLGPAWGRSGWPPGARGGHEGPEKGARGGASALWTGVILGLTLVASKSVRRTVPSRVPAGPSGAPGDHLKGPRAGPGRLGVPGGSPNSSRRSSRALGAPSCGLGGMVEGPQLIRSNIGL